MTAFAQGEIYCRKVEQIPEGLEPFCEVNEKGEWIISHSESGHHHLLECSPGTQVFEKIEGANAGMREFYAIVKSHTQLYQDAAVPHDPHTLVQGSYHFVIAREFDPIMQQARQVSD